MGHRNVWKARISASARWWSRLLLHLHLDRKYVKYHFLACLLFFCAGERWKPLWLFRVEIGNALACTDIAACRFRKRGMIFIVLETILKRMRFLWGIQRAYLPDCRCTFSLHNRKVFLFATHRHGPPATGLDTGLAIGPPTDTAHPTQARPTNFPGPTRPVHKQYMTFFVFVAHIGRSDLSEAQEIPTCRFLYRRSETNRLLPWS